MGLPVIVLFAAAWALILLPSEYRARREASGAKSISAFERAMSMLARHCGRQGAGPSPSGRQVLVPEDPTAIVGPKSRMRQRQRTALARLGILTSVAGGSAVLVGGRLWVVFGANAAAFAGYALLVARVRARQAEHRRKVRPLERAAAAHVQDGDDAAAPHVRVRRWVG